MSVIVETRCLNIKDGEGCAALVGTRGRLFTTTVSRTIFRAIESELCPSGHHSPSPIEQD